MPTGHVVWLVFFFGSDDRSQFPWTFAFHLKSNKSGTVVGNMVYVFNCKIVVASVLVRNDGPQMS